MYIYTIYQITNKINQKKYIGVHKTDNLNDSYMGSGRAIKNAIKRHGIENFTKEILHIFDNAEDAFKKESEIVTEEFVSTSQTYNMKKGGRGGWDHVRDEEVQKKAITNMKKTMIAKYGVEHISRVPEVQEKIKATLQKKGAWNKGKTGIYSKKTLKKMSDAAKKRKASDETKRKISEGVKRRYNEKKKGDQ